MELELTKQAPGCISIFGSQVETNPLLLLLKRGERPAATERIEFCAYLDQLSPARKPLVLEQPSLNNPEKYLIRTENR